MPMQYIDIITHSILITIAFCFVPFGIVYAEEHSETGKEVYENYCAECHSSGAGGAPKITDRSEWEARLEKGSDTLLEHAEQGFQGEKGQMPPKGGHQFLTRESLEAAIEHMGHYPQIIVRPKSQ